MFVWVIQTAAPALHPHTLGAPQISTVPLNESDGPYEDVEEGIFFSTS